MAQTGVRVRIGTVTLRMLAGILLALGMVGMTFAVSSAQYDPGGSDGGDWDSGDWWDRDDDGDDSWRDWDGGDLNDDGMSSPRDFCDEVFPNVIFTGNSRAGSIDCSVLLGGGDPPHDHGDKDHGDKDHGDKDHGDKKHDDKDHGDKKHGDKKHDDKDHGDKKHEEKKVHEAVGGQEEVKVTSLPSTGYGQDSGSNVTTAGTLAVLALAFASLAGITLRLSGARASRR